MASTLSCTKASATYPVYQPMGAGACGVAQAVYDTSTTALVINDVIQFFYLPPCSVVWGWFITSDIDTGTETLEIDVGTSSDVDQILDSGVLTGDAITDLLGAHAAAGASNVRILNGLNAGPIAYTSETLIQGKVIAAPHGGGTGTVYLGLFYTAT